MGCEMVNVWTPSTTGRDREPRAADKGAEHRTTPDSTRFSTLKPRAHERLHCN
jgi:hypothetical protein